MLILADAVTYFMQVMPSTNKARVVFDSGKTSSYHIKSIADCQQSGKTSSIFKLILNRAAGNKRYDFEAENPKLAGRSKTLTFSSVIPDKDPLLQLK